MSVSDEVAIGEIVDGSDLIDWGLIGRERRLKIDIFCIEKVELIFDFDDSQNERGELDFESSGKFKKFPDIWYRDGNTFEFDGVFALVYQNLSAEVLQHRDDLSI